VSTQDRRSDIMKQFDVYQPADNRVWRCTTEQFDGMGITYITEYAKTEQDMLIFKDKGFTCTLLT
jgi:hypothetical protein